MIISQTSHVMKILSVLYTHALGDKKVEFMFLIGYDAFVFVSIHSVGGV